MRKDTYSRATGPETFIVPLLKKHIVETVQSIKNKNNNRVLDVGCGNQPFRSLLTREGWDYESLDIEQNEDGNVDYIGKIDNHLEIQNKYELVICTEVLEHVLDWKTAFRNFNFLLADNGRLLITTPFFYPLHEEPYDYWRPSHHAIEAFAKKNGFDIERFLKAGNAFDVLGTISKSLYLKPKQSGLRAKLWYMVMFRAQKWLNKGLENKVIQLNVDVESNYYLSNIFLLRKAPV